jgi:ketosteroid isomerase-like protein
MGTTAENKELLRRIFEGLAQKNGELFVASMADDFSWTVTGTTKWSRTYSGKKTVLSELFGTLREKIAGPTKTTAERIVADGDFVVVEARGDNVTRTGKPYSNRYCFVFRLADGKLKEVTEYLDTELVTSAFSL